MKSSLQNILVLFQTPYVTGMVPTYGPDSGGTRIEIRGGFLGNMSNAAMNVGMVPCTLMPSEKYVDHWLSNINVLPKHISSILCMLYTNRLQLCAISPHQLYKIRGNDELCVIIKHQLHYYGVIINQEPLVGVY